MSGDGYTCFREQRIRRTQVSNGNCEAGETLNNIDQRCFETCSDGSPRDSMQACFGSCPAGTTLCGGENGLLCLDDNQTCVDYGIDLAGYIAEWVGAGASGNVLHIVSLASEIPDRTEPECDNW